LFADKLPIDSSSSIARASCPGSLGRVSSLGFAALRKVSFASPLLHGGRRVACADPPQEKCTGPNALRRKIKKYHGTDVSLKRTREELRSFLFIQLHIDPYKVTDFMSRRTRMRSILCNQPPAEPHQCRTVTGTGIQQLSLRLLFSAQSCRLDEVICLPT
jgi:hypothetical protein